MLPKVVITADPQEQWTDSPQLERLKKVCLVDYYIDLPTSNTELIDRVAGADFVISPVVFSWNADLLKKFENLKMIVLLAIGTDSVDLNSARKSSIDVCNVPGKTAEVVAEHALALMLAVARRMYVDTKAIKAGSWDQVRTIMLKGKRLGIIGTGAIGVATAKLAKAIGMEVVAWTFNPSTKKAQEIGLQYLKFEEVISTSDVLSIHLKSTQESYRLIAERELALMKKRSILVNVSRGAILDSDAVAAALLSGHLAGLGADVFEQEPLEANHPWLPFDNVVLTPHVADYTPEGMELLNEGAVDNVLAFIAGKPINIVN